ncbi:MAG: cyclic lactone autoinducer peptide [Alphaproteobacteria bacterium]|nr:cyclic lactone autoinducer peptide [Alphaproteobacteria bacterium]MBQ3545193.1 cyclic lactone autoinducer peptide [Lachnospiraceae bacterium]MBQ6993797.1 cyclic lactone autoinducer peptide [Lachnospiraceae bacterium]
MKKTKMTKNLVKKVAMYVAKADANAACPCITYQPKMPDSVKKLRKF